MSKVKSKTKRTSKKSKVNFYQFVFLICMAVIAIFGAIQVGLGSR